MGKINNKVFLWNSDDNSLKYEVEFIQGNPLKYTHLGKTYAKKTQCLIKRNGFVLKENSVTKHEKDKDETLYAFMNAFRPIQNAISSKDIRLNIINQILEYAKTN
jgi:hypothetical protein